MCEQSASLTGAVSIDSAALCDAVSTSALPFLIPGRKARTLWWILGASKDPVLRSLLLLEPRGQSYQDQKQGKGPNLSGPSTNSFIKGRPKGNQPVKRGN